MNPVSDVTDAVIALVKLHRLNEWARSLFGLSLSGGLTFSFACGSAMLTAATAHTSAPICWVIGFGSGLVTAVPVMSVYFYKDPLFKGVMLVIPKAQIVQEIAASAEEQVSVHGK